MKIHLLTLSMGVLVLALTPAASSIDFTSAELSSEESTWQLYERWCKKYPDGRGCNDDDKSGRLDIFRSRVQEINIMNTGVIHNRRRLNEFSDITDDEFKETFGSCFLKSREELLEHDVITGDQFTFANDDIPDYVDWASRGAVTQVMDQGSCGACWAFAAAGAVEGIHMIENGILMQLSVQELLDCSISRGCDGGNAVKAFNHVIDADGIAKWEDNPYVATRLNCHKAQKVVAIGGYKFVPRFNETALKQAVASQPVVVSVDTTGWAKHYQAGRVFSGPCGQRTGHQALLVGYGTAQEQDIDGSNYTIDYWKIKNSWGVHRGEKGYYRLERGYEETGGLCGILRFAMYPVEPIELID
ncbi:hypothetical protein ACQJBY_006735 [Aegilops geniculata]